MDLALIIGGTALWDSTLPLQEETLICFFHGKNDLMIMSNLFINNEYMYEI